MFQRAPSRIVTFPVFRTPRDFFCFFCDVSLFSPSFSLSLFLSLSLSLFASVSLPDLFFRSFVRSFVALVSGARHVILDDSLDQRRRIASLCPLEAGNDGRDTLIPSLLSYFFSLCRPVYASRHARNRSLPIPCASSSSPSSSFLLLPERSSLLFSSLLFSSLLSSLFFFSFLPSFLPFFLCFLLRFFRYYS